jgi:hypothetical protein
MVIGAEISTSAALLASSFSFLGTVHNNDNFVWP